ncbi:hypothetical protein [Tenacibaculum maritimum]|uniref:hypothetical protein n=1 Tax=Tenacibaculum maritimum TaxID=107401 RepID=UPI0012E55888|nr:hypothetical protein [Tenacibaculum maritimum]CAA0204391.1 hypothetical protein UCDSB2_250008 [Tenacibaculum maritimum]
MKIKFPSTETEPLNFFKWFYNNDIINDYLDWFFDDKKDINHFTEPRLNPSQKANRLDGYIEYLCPNNNFELVKVTIEESLNKYLSIQSTSTIKLITNNVNELIKDSKGYQHQLKFYIKELNNIEYSQKELIEKHPFLLKPIIDIQNYINRRYLNGSIREYLQEKDETDRLIYEIFGFLKEHKFLNLNDFSRLVKYTKYLIINQEIPEIKKRIPVINGVDGGIIKRAYHTLWYYENKKRRIRQILIAKFIVEVFEEYKDNDPNVTLKGLKKKKDSFQEFVPDIIKELL